VICLDGSEPGYIEEAIKAGVAPTFARFMKDGAHVHADSVIPSFTNPNNLSIITGRPPSVHGIAGNYFYDAANDCEVMMNDPQFLRSPTIDLMYLSTTDYIQHKVGPGNKIANDFYAMIDRYLAELDALGCNVVATADHGMNDKYTGDGKPDVLYLQDLFDQWVGAGQARVILPITDPYVAHHGSLGSFATIYTPAGHNAGEMIQRLQDIAGVELALTRNAACNRFELPTDCVGDIVVISGRHKVLGTSRARHDLSGLTEPLRSHGGLAEQRVPLIANRKIVVPPGHVLRNFDVFDVAHNRIQ
jgi:phosphonoacetate hydrolase